MSNSKRMFRKAALCVAVCSSLAMLSNPALASNNDGGLKGTVQTSTKQPVVSATVVVLNQETGFKREVQADAEGKFRFGSLPVGTYRVTIIKDGFQEDAQTVRIGIGEDANVNAELLEVGVERIEVTGNVYAGIDIGSSETALNISSLELERLPVPRNVTSVALLAPGTTAGDDRFDDGKGNSFASFGGASVAENSFFVNGLNVTNFRNGLGFSEIPFEFYEQFQIKTGGYSAEFGRSTGGVVNAVTKRGTNEFKAKFNAYFQPDSLREQAPNTYYRNGDYYVHNNADGQDNLNYDFSISGALIQDTLFYYLIYAPKDTEQTYTSGEGTDYTKETSDSAFWGGKIDWQINENHLLEFLMFSDKNTAEKANYGYDSVTETVGNYASTAYGERGGDNWSVKYTGYITDDLNMSVLYGENEFDLTDRSTVGADCALISDNRANKPLGQYPGCAGTNDYRIETGNDQRKAFRIDFEWQLDDHLLRFGMDHEKNSSYSNQLYSGPDGNYIVLYDAKPGQKLSNGATVPAGVSNYARTRYRTVSGDFEVLASAFYIEDIWNVTDTVTLTLGLRNETFDNRNSIGETFAKIDDMIAPRLGVAWDINGDGNTKVYANVGRYFLPIASNTNVRLSGNELDYYEFFEYTADTFKDYNGNQILVPTWGAQIGERQYNANGEIPDTTTIVDQDLDPMYQDEILIGYQTVVADDWIVGVKGIQRLLNGAIDDMLIDHWTQANYGCDHVNHNYLLGNPGKDATLNVDTNCDGVADQMVTIPGNELGYPEAERTYRAIEVTLDRPFYDGWSAQFSYTWSKSYGNSEGLVKSDNAQTDAGLTQDFDLPQLMDGAYGNLPNDRRHMIKAYGAYELTDNLIVGANLLLESGRPMNSFGIGHPGGIPDYGDTYYTCKAGCESDNPEYVKFTRGTYGRTPWTARLDLSAVYSTKISDLDVKFRADVFNVLNATNPTRYNETAEEGAPGQANPRFGLATAYQKPRYVQFAVTVAF